MRMALEEARQGDYAFGCVIARDNEVIARGHNLGKTNDDPTAHGEMVAIRRCLADRGSAVLRGATLYTSGEPCVMCMGAIVWCGIGRVVFAASVPQICSLMNQRFYNVHRFEQTTHLFRFHSNNPTANFRRRLTAPARSTLANAC